MVWWTLNIPTDATPSKKRRATSGGVGHGPLPVGVARSAKASVGRQRGGIPLLLCTAGGVDNPILAALGGTPRSLAAAANGFAEPEPLNLAQSSGEAPMHNLKEAKTAAPEPKRTIDSTSFGTNHEEYDVDGGSVLIIDTAVCCDFVAYAREHIHSQEAGEEGFSIDPSERAVEHRASKVVRREILIASPAANDEEDWEGNLSTEVVVEDIEEAASPAEHFDLQPIDIILHVFSFLVTDKDLKNMAGVSSKWRELTNRRSLYRTLSSMTGEGSVNWLNFQNLGVKNKGTEGTCFKCCQRSTGKILALKRARVFPKIRKLLHQLLDAIAYCHRRGVLHRNLKPKHLLIKTSDPQNLDDATLQISDFALVRATGIPRRTYTMEVVTLWYRPPEILMGVRGYSSAVDIWSVGCIFAEMAQGKPLFTGISEIDQLFQIFSKLSTPTAETWPGFSSLPNYHFEFPHWKRRPLNRLFPGISDLGIDLLTKLLVYNPDQRITAEDALRHPYFSSQVPAFLPLAPKIPMDQMCYTMSRARIGPTPEHVELFHAYLRQTELESWKEIKYLRCVLVILVVDVFEMCLRTAFLAVNYTDRYLDIVMVKKTKFQLLGATCLHVASKCEDVSYIGVEDLAMCADNVYTSVEVLEMEEKLLNALNFTLSVPTGKPSFP
ncbi:hypothetical protein BBJ28_00021093, partial [Nothophytophthora sp. Chile5]